MGFNQTGSHLPLYLPTNWFLSPSKTKIANILQSIIISQSYSDFLFAVNWSYLCFVADIYDVFATKIQLWFWWFPNSITTLLGHCTLQMSMRYSHLAKEHLKSAIREAIERWGIKTPLSPLLKLCSPLQNLWREQTTPTLFYTGTQVLIFSQNSLSACSGHRLRNSAPLLCSLPAFRW